MAKKTKTEQEEPLEKKLWKAADKLRKNMDAAEYKHVALGLIFLKYISDAFEEQYQKLVAQKSEGADPEDKNEYLAEKVFFVPLKARWNYIQGRATLPTVGKDIDDAMDTIENDNPSLRGVLPKVFAQEKLDKTSLGGLVNLVGSATLGTKEAQSKDLLGRVFEYFLGEFALAEGKKGGQFYTPGSVVKLLVEMLEPYEGRVFDPCCGSGGMFVQSEKFINKHQDHYKKKGKVGLSLNPVDRISIYGQESNQTTWRLAKMNLSIRGIDSSNVKWNNEGSFLNTQIPACLWFLSRNKANGGFRKREDEILFIDARNMGFLVNRKNRELSADDIALIAGTYHNWRSTEGNYEDIAGFCKVATIEEVRKLNHVLTPGRYVGLADEKDDFNFEERFTALKAELEKQIAEEAELNKKIADNLSKILIQEKV